jgi:hypothetical protein
LHLRPLGGERNRQRALRFRARQGRPPVRRRCMSRDGSRTAGVVLGLRGFVCLRVPVGLLSVGYSGPVGDHDELHPVARAELHQDS